jgi:hypothetical protein
MRAAVTGFLDYILYIRPSMFAQRLVGFCLFIRYFIANRLTGRPLHIAGDAVMPVSIVSLTSYPRRLGGAYQAIESLFAQRIKPEKVILWLARDEISEDAIPQSLKRLQRRGLDIRFVDINLGSHKKLYYAAKEYPNHIIVTADDDTCYPPGWLEGLYEKHKANTGCILCYRGHFLRKRSDGKGFLPYIEMRNKPVAGHVEPSYSLMPTGGSGVLYPQGVFDAMFFDIDSYLAHSMNADDIWYKAMGVRNNVKTLRIGAHNKLFVTTCFSYQKNALWKQSDASGHNDKVLQALTGLWPEILEKVEPVETLRIIP